MAVITPKYDMPMELRFPDAITNPANSKFDYLYSTINKTFLFKTKGVELTTVVIDNQPIDHLYEISQKFTNPL